MKECTDYYTMDPRLRSWFEKYPYMIVMQDIETRCLRDKFHPQHGWYIADVMDVLTYRFTDPWDAVSVYLPKVAERIGPNGCYKLQRTMEVLERVWDAKSPKYYYENQAKWWSDIFTIVLNERINCTWANDPHLDAMTYFFWPEEHDSEITDKVSKTTEYPKAIDEYFDALYSEQ